MENHDAHHAVAIVVRRHRARARAAENAIADGIMLARPRREGSDSKPESIAHREYPSRIKRSSTHGNVDGRKRKLAVTAVADVPTPPDWADGPMEDPASTELPSDVWS